MAAHSEALVVTLLINTWDARACYNRGAPGALSTSDLMTTVLSYSSRAACILP